MTTKHLQTELEDLRKRVEELERIRIEHEKIYQPYRPPINPWHPNWPYPTQPYFGDPPHYPYGPTCSGNY